MAAVCEPRGNERKSHPPRSAKTKRSTLRLFILWDGVGRGWRAWPNCRTAENEWQDIPSHRHDCNPFVSLIIHFRPPFEHAQIIERVCSGYGDIAALRGIRQGSHHLIHACINFRNRKLTGATALELDFAVNPRSVPSKKMPVNFPPICSNSAGGIQGSGCGIYMLPVGSIILKA